MTLVLGALIGPLGVPIFAVLTLALFLQLRDLENLLSSSRVGNDQVVDLLKNWVFCRPSKMRWSHWASEFPPIIAVLIALIVIGSLGLGLVVLRFNVPIVALLLGGIYLFFPLYRAVDGLDAYFLAKAARKERLSEHSEILSEDDVNMLLQAKKDLADGVRYFGLLATLYLVVMVILYIDQQALQVRYAWTEHAIGEIVSLVLFTIAMLGASFSVYHFKPLVD